MSVASEWKETLIGFVGKGYCCRVSIHVDDLRVLVDAALELERLQMRGSLGQLESELRARGVDPTGLLLQEFVRTGAK